jgi:cyclophilin family peptidyl-prolyl cis-trans isomerase
MQKYVISLAVALNVLFLGLSMAAPRLQAQEDGIYADFATSKGSFTCRLYYTNAPKAVANFIGLATGARAWVDETSGRVRTNAFHNGLTFHRVIKGFMLQGGSPNGLGTDGPGYAFSDEFSPSLRHDGPGVLSSANSGPNSNGAQFFVTVAATAWLNDVHTIFGRVIAGQDVVDAISQVAVDASDKPLTDVVVQTVSIRRVGATAQAFDIQAQGLPVVSCEPLRIASSGGENTLTFQNRLFAENFLSVSTNLTAWVGSSLGIDVVAPASNSVKQAMTGPTRFYTLSRVQYPASTFAPRTLLSRTLTLSFDGGLWVLPIVFDSAGGGTYKFNGTPGTVTSYTWSQDIYRGRLWPIYYSALVPMTLRLDFTGDLVGKLTGTAYTTPSQSVTGTFTLSAP